MTLTSDDQSPTNIPALYSRARTLGFEQFQEYILDLLCSAMACTHVSINTFQQGAHVTSFSRGFSTERMGEAWVDIATPDDDLLTRKALMQPGSPAIINWTDTELQSTAGEIARRFMAQFGLSHGIAVAVQSEGVCGVTLFSLCRRTLELPFLALEAQNLASIGPHVTEALMVNRLRANVRHGVDDAAAIPMAFVTRDGWIIYPNAAFVLAWSMMSATASGMEMPKVPDEWLDGTHKVITAQGWSIHRVGVDDGIRIELHRFPENGQVAKLTGREIEVARLYSKGYSHKEISRLLEISPNTIRAHIGHIFDKVQISSRTQLRTILKPAREDVPFGSPETNA